MKVALVRPPSGISAVTVPLGMMYLASYLRQRDHLVEIIDARLHRMSLDQVMDTLETSGADLIGIGALTFEAPQAHQLAQLIKARWPGRPVVFGGPDVSSSPVAALRDPNVDYAVVGEGELSFAELVDRLQARQSVEDVLGIGFRRDGEVVITAPRPYIDNLDELPLPAYDLIDLKKHYRSKVVHGSFFFSTRSLPIITSRGCPFQCIYCHKIFGKRIRYRSPENVVAEIGHLVNDLGAVEIHIEDDSFNVDMERAKRLCDLIAESGMRIKIAFPNGIRADFVDEDLIAKMKRAGVYRIAYGIEAGSPRVQRLIRKRLDLGRVKQAIDLTVEAGISAHGFFMVGFPDESREEIEETVRFAERSSLVTAGFSRVIPFAGTELHAMLKSRGMMLPEGPEAYQARSEHIHAAQVSQEELVRLSRDAYWRFYFSPGRIWRILRIAPRRMVLLNLGKILRKVVSFPFSG
ncbi:MAG: B12-binding domain-containing radical SAM protein [Bacteroidetes bacterium]|nr:B12-binding domain-containing radical SAM protein [Bacteroidota bacterium]MCL5026212.1 B12-binding domain-containing radical SAM protein [Chloroflexota bacterium]